MRVRVWASSLLVGWEARVGVVEKNLLAMLARSCWEMAVKSKSRKREDVWEGVLGVVVVVVVRGEGVAEGEGEGRGVLETDMVRWFC